MTEQSGSAGWSVPQRVCVLCGDTGLHVAHALIRWRGAEAYRSGPRCDDPAACWQRVADRGEEWPVADGQPIRPSAQSSEAPAPSEPSPAAEELDFGSAPEATA